MILEPYRPAHIDCHRAEENGYWRYQNPETGTKFLNVAFSGSWFALNEYKQWVVITDKNQIQEIEQASAKALIAEIIS